jgi:hypothetical protein
MKTKFTSSGRSWAAALLANLALIITAACSTTTVQGSVYQADAGGGADGVLFGDSTYDSKSSPDTGGGEVAPSDGAVSDGVAANTLQYAVGKDDFGGTCDTLCALLVNQNATRKVKVRYLVGGQPAPVGTPITFEMVDPQSSLGLVLTPGVMTDELGEAEAEIKANGTVGKFAVVAKAPDDATVAPLTFDFTVQSKAKGPLTITAHYKGVSMPAEMGNVQVRLTKQIAGVPACKSLDLGDTLPVAAWTSPNLKWDTPWGLSFPSLAGWVQKEAGTDGVVTFTAIGVAFPAKGGTKPVAGGCVDTGVTMHVNAQGVVEGDDVTVNFYDLPPRLKGTYDLISHFDLLSVLPDPVELVLKTVLNIVTDPVAGILGLTCKLGGNTLESMCKYVFMDPANPQIKDLTAVGNIIVKFLDALLMSYLPQNIKTGLSTGADLNEILTNLEIGGTIEIKAEPDSTGFLPAAQTKEVWSTVTYKWTLGQTCDPKDPNCGKKTFNVEAFQSDAIVGQFDLWRDALKSQVKIGQHALKVKWGALLNYIVQKQLLPAMTGTAGGSGPVVDSYAKLLKSLLAPTGKQCLVQDSCCDDFAAKLATQQSVISAGFLSSTCEALINLGTGYLEATLNGLDGTSGDPTKGSGLLLSANACNIFETNQDQLIDLWGGPMLADQCVWDMTITVGGSPQTLKGTFYAKRQQ